MTARLVLDTFARAFLNDGPNIIYKRDMAFLVSMLRNLESRNYDTHPRHQHTLVELATRRTAGFHPANNSAMPFNSLIAEHFVNRIGDSLELSRSIHRQAYIELATDMIGAGIPIPPDLSDSK